MNATTNRDGNWMDKSGACKICDGELPHGHADNCDVYKQEQQIAALQKECHELRILSCSAREDILLARAEKAEAEVKRLAEAMNKYSADEMMGDTWKDRATKLEAEVAELKKSLNPSNDPEMKWDDDLKNTDGKEKPS